MSTTTTAPSQKYIGDLHHEHLMWLNILQFRKEETSILEHRAEDIAKRNNRNEIMAELEHYQNEFIRQREVIDELSHDIKLHEQFMALEAMDKPLTIEHKHFTDHAEMRDRMEVFEKLYWDMKDDFYRWLTKWL